LISRFADAYFWTAVLAETIPRDRIVAVRLRDDTVLGIHFIDADVDIDPRSRNCRDPHEGLRQLGIV
jgi:hypothetical protein